MTDKELWEITEVLHACSFDELCRQRLLDEEFIVQCVQLGITNVQGEYELPRLQWVFSAPAVSRLQKASRLHRELDIGLGELAFVLDLLDEMDALRAEVDSLRKRLRHWEQ